MFRQVAIPWDDVLLSFTAQVAINLEYNLYIYVYDFSG